VVVLPAFIDSGWTLRLYRGDAGLVLGLFWGTKATPTHEVEIDKEAFLRCVESL